MLRCFVIFPSRQERFLNWQLAWLACAGAALGCAVGPKSSPSGASLASETRASSRKALVRRVLSQNVRLFVLEGDRPKRSASGVVVGSEATAKGAMSYVVTNAHAIATGDLKEARLLVVVDHGQETMEYPAEPIAIGEVPQVDLALIRVPGVSLPAASLAADEELELGDDVVVVAAPFGRALSLSGGMVSHIEWDKEAKVPRMLKTDAPIGYGASGGGVYSLATGRLLAIVEGYRTAKIGFEVEKQLHSIDVPMPGETFAAPSAKVRRFLQSKGFARFLSQVGKDARASVK
ncbi:MAG: S1 family peptidase [Myxococcota bacterium]